MLVMDWMRVSENQGYLSRRFDLDNIKQMNALTANEFFQGNMDEILENGYIPETVLIVIILKEAKNGDDVQLFDASKYRIEFE